MLRSEKGPAGGLSGGRETSLGPWEGLGGSEGQRDMSSAVGGSVCARVGSVISLSLAVSCERRAVGRQGLLQVQGEGDGTADHAGLSTLAWAFFN